MLGDTTGEEAGFVLAGTGCVLGVSTGFDVGSVLWATAATTSRPRAKRTIIRLIYNLQRNEFTAEVAKHAEKTLEGSLLCFISEFLRPLR